MAKPRDPARILSQNVDRVYRWASLEGGGEAPIRRVHEIMNRAAVSLEQRLRSAEGLGGPGEGSFTATQMRVTLNQIEDTLRQVRGMLSGVIMDSSVTAATRSSRETIDYMNEAERAYRGVTQGLMLNEAAIMDRVASGTEASVLRRLATSGEPQSGLTEPHPGKVGILDRYGLNVVGKFEETMQARFIARTPWQDVRRELIEQSPFLEAKRTEEGSGIATRWAERILRTETMNAHNRAGWQTIGEANKTLGDMIKILAATFDNRTAADSYAVHGQIRRPDEPFESWWGRYMHPPNRPNDREVVVPHRLCWPIPPALAPKSDAEVAGRWAWEGRKGSPPPRPKMTTIPLGEIGKAPAPPPLEEALAAAKAPFETPIEAAPPLALPAIGDAPSVMVDGERLPQLGKGMDWGDSARIEYEDFSSKKPASMGAVPWKIVEAYDMGGTARQNRAIRTLQRLRGGSYASGKGPLESLGFKVPKPAKLKAITGQIDQRIARDAITETKVNTLLRDPASGVTKQNMRLDRLSFLRSDFDLFEVRNQIRAAEVGGSGSARIVAVKHEGELFVVQGESLVASRRLLGDFEAEMVVIDLDHRSPKPKNAAQMAEALPPAMNSPADGARMRSAVRDWYANDGVGSRDISHLREGSAGFVVKDLPPGIGGYHLWNGEIQVDSWQTNEGSDLNKALASIKEGRRTDRHAWATVLHEESHGHSPCGAGAYRDSARGLEEATTELYARKKWRELFKVEQPRHLRSFDEDPTIRPMERNTRRNADRVSDEERQGFRPVYEAPVAGGRARWVDQSAGSYREFTAALYDLTHTHTGLHPDLIPELVDRATVRMRQGSASVQSPEEFVRLYVEALSGIEVAAHGKKGTVSFGPAARDEMVRTMLDDQRLRFTP